MGGPLMESVDTILVGLVGTVATLVTAWWSRRGSADVGRLQAEQDAYSRATEIDAGVVGRLESENARLTAGWRADREAWERERAEFRAEADRLEERIRELLDDAIALRTRHEHQPRMP